PLKRPRPSGQSSASRWIACALPIPQEPGLLRERDRPHGESESREIAGIEIIAGSPRLAGTLLLIVRVARPFPIIHGFFLELRQHHFDGLLKLRIAAFAHQFWIHLDLEVRRNAVVFDLPRSIEL